MLGLSLLLRGTIIAFFVGIVEAKLAQQRPVFFAKSNFTDYKPMMTMVMGGLRSVLNDYSLDLDIIFECKNVVFPRTKERAETPFQIEFGQLVGAANNRIISPAISLLRD